MGFISNKRVTQQLDPAREALTRYFSQSGMLLCNTSEELPYLDLVGGSWNAIISMMEDGLAYYSRFYKNRVTYLSSALYIALKPYRRRLDRLDDDSMRLLDFLQAAGEANAEQMQQTLLLTKKAQTDALNRLVSELFVTVIHRDVTMNETWCSFTYGLAETWEQRLPREIHGPKIGEAEEILLRQLSQKQVKSLLR